MLLEVKGLHAGYGRHRVVTDVSLQVDKGELIAVVGSNGAGKTTLLRAISGSLKPSSGQVLLKGREVTRLATFKMARLGMGHVPEGRHVFPDLAVLDHLKLGGARVGKEDREASLEAMFELFPRLKERQKQAAGSLSGGEQQMLVIARALMGSPEVLLIDEPSLGLAPLAIEAIFDAIIKLRESGLTALVVEQNARLALEVSDRAYVLEQGAVSLEGRAHDLLDDPRVIEAYLRTGAEASDEGAAH